MTMTRGEILDQLTELSGQDAEYRKALIEDPRGVISEQFDLALPEGLRLKVVEDTADTVHIALPHHIEPGAELSDLDLEAVGGGHTVLKESKCVDDGATGSSLAIDAGLY